MGGTSQFYLGRITKMTSLFQISPMPNAGSRIKSRLPPFRVALRTQMQHWTGAGDVEEVNHRYEAPTAVNIVALNVYPIRR